MLTHNIDYFRSKPDDLPKTTILLDNGYHPEQLTQALEAIYPEIMTKIQFELSAKLSKAEKAAKGQSGFVPVAARWVIERSNAWVERCKSLVKNFDRRNIVTICLKAARPLNSPNLVLAAADAPAGNSASPIAQNSSPAARV